MIRRLLIANRGEIAVRIARGARELGIAPLGIFSEADSRAYHLKFMEESRCVGPAAAAQSYLDANAIVAAAKALGADAVHPGYGFLSERASFARAVRDAGIIFVGPSPESMAAMGSKIEAKRRVRGFDVPVVPGYDGADQSPAALRAQAEGIGFPLLIKASAGGGGRGMRVVERAVDFGEALESAKREANSAFGNDEVLLERYLSRPRHIEFQILADSQGTTLHVGERECSIQRRHQKIVEESPSPALSNELRARMGSAAVRAAQSVQYVNAGTCEFMLDERGEFYFLEMNTRLQVEHPVTELVYGIDLVHWQLRIAAGERLSLNQESLRPRGWAIEGRIYAEDPANHLLPSTGTITAWDPPEGPGVRLDSGVESGSEVSVHYDPMLAKLIVWGEDRSVAIARFDQALNDFSIGGVRSNVPLLQWIARDDAFRRGEVTTGFLSERLDESIFVRQAEAPRSSLIAAIASLLGSPRAPWRLGQVGVPVRLQNASRIFTIEATRGSSDGQWMLRGDVSGDLRILDRRTAQFEDERIVADAEIDATGVVVRWSGREDRFAFAAAPSMQTVAAGHASGANGRVLSPMPGKVAKIAVRGGQDVEAHDLLVVLEAMKMEHRIEASGAGTVQSIHVREGEIVPADALLVELG